MQSLQEQLEQAISVGTHAEEITPETVLGLSSDEINELRRHQNSLLPSEISVIGNAQTIKIGNAAYIRAVSGSEPRRIRQLSESLRGLAHKYQRAIIIDDHSGATIAPGWLRIVLPQECSGFTRVAGRKMAQRKDPAPPQSSTIIIEEETIGYIEDGTAYLLIHPFLRGDSFSLAGFDDKLNLLEEIIKQCLNIEGLWSGDKKVAEKDSLAEAVAVLDMIPGFARAVRSSENAEGVDEARQKINEITLVVNGEQDKLAHALKMAHDLEKSSQLLSQVDKRATKAAEALLNQAGYWKDQAKTHKRSLQDEQIKRKAAVEELEQLLKSLDAISGENLAQAIVEVMRIRANRCVLDCRLSGGQGIAPNLEVRLQPLVLSHNEQNYLCQELVFTLPLTGAVRPNWLMPQEKPYSPHPHVATSGTTCWGEAEVPIAQAMENREFSTVVRFITGWARTYNAQSPYVSINQFPKTNLSEGYQIP